MRFNPQEHSQNCSHVGSECFPLCAGVKAPSRAFNCTLGVINLMLSCFEAEIETCESQAAWNREQTWLDSRRRLIFQLTLTENMKTGEKIWKDRISDRRRRCRDDEQWNCFLLRLHWRRKCSATFEISAFLATNARSVTICRRSHPGNREQGHVCDQVVKIFTVKLNSFCAIEFSASAIWNRTVRRCEKKGQQMIFERHRSTK